MCQEGEGVSLEEKAEEQNKPLQRYSGENNYALIAVCVFLSMLFMKTGLLSFLFMVPLGYAVLVSGSLWITFFAAAAANVVLSLVLHLRAVNNSSLWADILYFTIILLMFIWITGGKNIRTAYRLILASVAGAVAFNFLIMNNRSDSSFNLILSETSELLASIFVSSSGNNAAVQQAFTPERVLELIKSVSIRGGAVISMLLIFFLNRQITLAAMWLIKRKRDERSLIQYFAPPVTIWCLSGALAVVLLSSMFRIVLLEILAWNALTICAVLFLAQGAGIVLHLFARFTPTVRILASVLVMVIILSPLSAFAVAAVLILGIAEIWLPIRIKKVES